MTDTHAEIDALERAVIQTLNERKLDQYTPYPKQRDFHTAGGDPNIKERLFMAGNQLGKTFGAGGETTFHLILTSHLSIMDC